MLLLKTLLILLSFNLVAAQTNLTDAEILAFDAPSEIKEAFPYYLSGYDDQDAPIWIMESGKYDYRKYIEGGGELFEAMGVYFQQMFLNFRESGRNSSATQFVLIIDGDGFNIRQAGHAKSVQFFQQLFVRAEALFREGLIKQGYLINANALFDGIWNLGSPLLGSIRNSYEVYGTNKDIWIPKLLKNLPKDQLPEKYGGFPGHEPVKTLGK